MRREARWLLAVCALATAAALGCALPQECPGSLDAALGERVGQKVSLRDLTSFAWARAYLFGSGTRAERIRRSTGVSYRPYRDVVPRGRNLIAFQVGPRSFCLASVNTFRFHIDLDGREWFPDAPWFQVGTKRRLRRWPAAARGGPGLALCGRSPAAGPAAAAPLRDQRVLGGLVFGSGVCEDGA